MQWWQIGAERIQGRPAAVSALLNHLLCRPVTSSAQHTRCLVVNASSSLNINVSNWFYISSQIQILNVLLLTVSTVLTLCAKPALV